MNHTAALALQTSALALRLTERVAAFIKSFVRGGRYSLARVSPDLALELFVLVHRIGLDRYGLIAHVKLILFNHSP